MATYAVSDLHGCKKEFDEMLEKICFSDADEMYIIGDICDRGKESIPLLQEIIHHPNMHWICGNHDIWLADFSGVLIERKLDGNPLEMTPELNRWLNRNGGFITRTQFMRLPLSQCLEIKQYMSERKLYQFVEVNHRRFLLVHAGLPMTCTKEEDVSSVPAETLVWIHIGIDDNPLDDVTMVVGHMPTFFYGEEYENRIVAGKNGTIYHIDCGCVYGRSLGCLRLDDLQEFYVPSTYPQF